MPRKVDVGEFVKIINKNNIYFGKLAIICSNNGNEYGLIFPGCNANGFFCEANELKVITDNVVLSVIPRGGK